MTSTRAGSRGNPTYSIARARTKGTLYARTTWKRTLLVRLRPCLGLAIRLLGEVEAGRITTDVFKRSVTVQTGGDSLILHLSLEPIRISNITFST
jgi:hypothetical protein